MSKWPAVALRSSVLVVVSLLMSLGVCEAFVRLFHPQPPLLYQPDARLGWVHPAGASFHYPGRGGATRVQFNSQGLRDAEHAPEKPAGAFRVLILGDSYMEGVDVELEHTMAKQLERRLREEGVAAEVINAGVGGYGTDQEYLYLTEEGWIYQPDLVVVAVTVDNDVHDNLVKRYCRMTASGLVCAPPGQSRVRRAIVSVKTFLQEHLQVYFFVRQKTANLYPVRAVLSRLGLAEHHDAADLTQDYPVSLRMLLRAEDADLERGWELTTAILSRMRDDAAVHGARLAVVVIPGLAQVDAQELRQVLAQYQLKPSDVDVEQPNRRLRQFGEAQGIPVADLLPPLSEATRRGRQLYQGHWNREGHALAAERLMQTLNSAGLVDTDAR